MKSFDLDNGKFQECHQSYYWSSFLGKKRQRYQFCKFSKVILTKAFDGVVRNNVGLAPKTVEPCQQKVLSFLCE